MEKYSKWRDLGTGIQPFLPSIEHSSRLTLFLKYYSLGPLLALNRLLNILLLSLFHILLSYLISPLKLFKLNRIYSRLIDVILMRLWLFHAGFIYIESSIATLQKGARKTRVNSIVEIGDIIVANHTSFYDLVYLQYAYSPVFVKIDRNGNVYPCTIWQMLNQVGGIPDIEPKQNAMSLIEYSKIANAPIVVFPEGTTTNGRGILKFLPIFDNSKGLKIHLVGFKYPNDFSVSYTTNYGVFKHFYFTCCQFYNKQVAKLLPANDQKIENLKNVSELMCNLLRLRSLGLGVEDKLEFLEYFAMREGGYEKKKVKLS